MQIDHFNILIPSGMIPFLKSDALIIILEPEAAALSARGDFTYRIPHCVDLQPEDSLMVVDAGGGTVDITVHKVRCCWDMCKTSSFPFTSPCTN